MKKLHSSPLRWPCWQPGIPKTHKTTGTRPGGSQVSSTVSSARCFAQAEWPERLPHKEENGRRNHRHFIKNHRRRTRLILSVGGVLLLSAWASAMGRGSPVVGHHSHERQERTNGWRR